MDEQRRRRASARRAPRPGRGRAARPARRRRPRRCRAPSPDVARRRARAGAGARRRAGCGTPRPAAAGSSRGRRSPTASRYGPGGGSASPCGSAGRLADHADLLRRRRRSAAHTSSRVCSETQMTRSADRAARGAIVRAFQRVFGGWSSGYTSQARSWIVTTPGQGRTSGKSSWASGRRPRPGGGGRAAAPPPPTSSSGPGQPFSRKQSSTPSPAPRLLSARQSSRA